MNPFLLEGPTITHTVGYRKGGNSITDLSLTQIFFNATFPFKDLKRLQFCIEQKSAIFYHFWPTKYYYGVKHFQGVELGV